MRDTCILHGVEANLRWEVQNYQVVHCESFISQVEVTHGSWPC
jgi:sensor c-di-GMP phosphodiesterase-like protein